MICILKKRFSFSSSPEKPIPKDHNPLEHRYTFWLSKRKSVLKGKNYNDCMTHMGTFSTLQQFWHVYSFMKRPSKVEDPCDLMLLGIRIELFKFKKQIFPAKLELIAH